MLEEISTHRHGVRANLARHVHQAAYNVTQFLAPGRCHALAHAKARKDTIEMNVRGV
jgi:hypothetical protein